MENKFKTGDRVFHDFLGNATILKKLDFSSLYLIKTDNVPPIEYNMGQTETPEFEANLKLLHVQDGDRISDFDYRCEHKGEE